ncbi:uridine-2'-O--methyltransferase TRM7 [Eremomyces bilateralis CBS 781.70]|uniref:Putative tRNA (cytidine(32)/guanosine(34)-2'-O)-methyltransferase n=1 Tax=Eremomyces bilateralis CBS 781.70 TaxID=1392243 RepID=A0A6G1FQJ9_9PEZI|nr:uridine-2'-O--methyltransferase TRM7 [Eremomyces bilateralis CBS 781.70]KAF1807971.1 uridine-2'-O--methyltransferase TRM7 [Eremomyces bilateralis CBS 781.70]
MGKSSKDKRDIYYRLAKEQGWRARSAFKLLQLDEEFNLFEGVTRVVDLCAAPGSWSQVLSRVLIKGERFGRAAYVDRALKELLNPCLGCELQRQMQEEHDAGVSSRDEQSQTAKNVKIVSVDLQPMSPLEGITTIRADITHPSTIPRLLDALDPGRDTSNPDTPTNPVDLVLCDGAPDVTGLHDMDIYVQSQLLYSALTLAMCILKPGGKFVAKIFRSTTNAQFIWSQMSLVFERVTIAKPKASRSSSLEAFVVCEGLNLPDGFKPSLDMKLGYGNIVPPRPKEGELASEESLRFYGLRTVREDGAHVLEFPMEDPSPDEELTDEEFRARRNAQVTQFLACGDLSSFDSDTTYQIPADYLHLDPVQPPTAAPYLKAIEHRRKEGGAYGKTKEYGTGKIHQKKWEATAGDLEEMMGVMKEDREVEGGRARLRQEEGSKMLS